MRALLLVALVACGGGPDKDAKRPVLVPSGPRLGSPQPIDPHARGATYLAAIGNQIQPRWAQFLEDCRMRLPSDHPLNQSSLVASIELVIAPDGAMLETKTINGSGNRDYDTAIEQILKEVAPGVPPPDLESDDGRVHVTWLFARDRRQAGPATSQVMVIELPLVATTQRLLQRGMLVRAANRLAAAPPTDGERLAATELVMIAGLREGLASSDGFTREAALEAVASAKLAVLAPDVHALVAANGQTQQRVHAIATSAVLGDAAVVPMLVDNLVADFDERPEVALAKVGALASLGKIDEATSAIHAILDPNSKHTTRATATAIAALGLAPDAKLALSFGRWFATGDADTRQAVCRALPNAALVAHSPRDIGRGQATIVVGKGLLDADASVRAACIGAVQVSDGRWVRGNPFVRLLLDLVRDRDETVRARAIAALGKLAPAQRPHVGPGDRAPQVRAAAAIGATDAELQRLAKDKDPDVRAAAIANLAERGDTELATAAARDTASQVRKAAITGITDDALLEALAGDSDPDVATAAIARYGAHRGRAAVTTAFLQRLVAATPKGLERVRIARAWLLAR